MTYAVENILNPRSFVYASNAEALVLQSATSETRLTFVNNTVGTNTIYPNFVISASNETFLLRKDTDVIAQFGKAYNEPLMLVPGKISSHTFEVPFDKASKKSIILKDFNRVSTHQFAGFGYEDGRTYYQLPNASAFHGFYASMTSTASLELMRLQTNGSGVAQVGIGTTSIASNVMMHVAGSTVIDGSLTVQGDLNFDRTGIVQLDAATSKIPSSNMPNGLLYLDQSTNKVDPTYLPQTFQFQYLRGQKNVGIGTRAPQQRLHVQGSSVFSERVGVGTFHPIARMHLYEPSAIIPTMVLENDVGGSLLEAKLMGAPSFTVVGTHVGVGIGTSVVPPSQSLQVEGNASITGTVTCSNITAAGSISLSRLLIEDPQQVYVQQSKTTTNGLVDDSMLCYLPFVFNSGMATSNITTTNGAPYVHFSECGVRVDGDFILGSQMFVLSDARVKSDVQILPNSLERLEQLHGYSYTLPSGKQQVGLLAQEVLDVLPQAVTKLPEDYYAVSYDSIVPLLVEAVRELSQQVKHLTAASGH